jgi:hypothetical protein
MALPRRAPVGLQSLTLAVPQLQRTAVGQLSKVLSILQPLDSIPFENQPGTAATVGSSFAMTLSL